MAFPQRIRFLWQLPRHTLSLGERTVVMAIVNLTPDSFSGDGLMPTGEAGERERALAAALAALDAGADILDLGAESTRPDAEPLSAAEEQDRLLPVLEAVRIERPNAVLSVDTYHAATARAAAQAGAEIINDVSGLEWDPAMAEAVAATGCGLVLMHTRGRPHEWRLQPALPAGEVLPVVFAGLCERLSLAEAAGISSECIVLDPGFGFGKLGAENLELLAGFGRLAELGRPLLAGLSRKRFLGDLLPSSDPPLRPEEQARASASVAEQRRVPTLAGNVAAVLAGAHGVRVHDVAETRQALAIADAVLASAASAPGAGYASR